MKQTTMKILGFAAMMTQLAACGSNSFGMQSVSEAFSQEASINNKVDIIWVVDSSGTMANHQQNLGDNFSAFITQFKDKGFDFNMVVASTDAWMREVNYNAGGCVANPNPSQSPATQFVTSADCQPTLASYGDLASFRDGDIYGAINGTPGARSGQYLITSRMNESTLINTFQTNVRTGVRGDGSREATFQSLRAVLRRNEDGSPAYPGETHTVLSSFRRSDAFLAVIVVADEEDQSLRQDGTPYADLADYTDSFVNFLSEYTSSSLSDRRFSVSGIVVEDLANCVYGLHPQASKSDRYLSIAHATRGAVGNICSPNFSNQLQDIAEKIITLATRFKLSREPQPETIKVVVNNREIPEDLENGWTYSSDNGSHYLEFHGTAVPPENAQISVNFDPATLK